MKENKSRVQLTTDDPGVRKEFLEAARAKGLNPEPLGSGGSFFGVRTLVVAGVPREIVAMNLPYVEKVYEHRN